MEAPSTEASVEAIEEALFDSPSTLPTSFPTQTQQSQTQQSQTQQSQTQQLQTPTILEHFGITLHDAIDSTLETDQQQPHLQTLITSSLSSQSAASLSSQSAASLLSMSRTRGRRWLWDFASWHGIPVSVKTLPFASFEPASDRILPNQAHNLSPNQAHNLSPNQAHNLDDGLATEWTWTSGLGAGDGEAAYVRVLQTLQRLRQRPHPAVLSIYAVVRDQDAIYVIMERPVAPSLARSLASWTSLHLGFEMDSASQSDFGVTAVPSDLTTQRGSIQHVNPPAIRMLPSFATTLAAALLHLQAVLHPSGFGALAPSTIFTDFVSLKIDPIPITGFVDCAPPPSRWPSHLWPFFPLAALQRPLLPPSSLQPPKSAAKAPASHSLLPRAARATDSYAFAAIIRTILTLRTSPYPEYPAPGSAPSAYPPLSVYQVARPWISLHDLDPIPIPRQLKSALISALSSDPRKRPTLQDLVAACSSLSSLPHQDAISIDVARGVIFVHGSTLPDVITLDTVDEDSISGTTTQEPPAKVKEKVNYLPYMDNDNTLLQKNIPKAQSQMITAHSSPDKPSKPSMSSITPTMLQSGPFTTSNTLSSEQSDRLIKLYMEALQMYADAPVDADIDYYKQVWAKLYQIYDISRVFFPFWITLGHLLEERPSIVSPEQMSELNTERARFIRSLSKSDLALISTVLQRLFEKARSAEPKRKINVMIAVVYASYQIYVKNDQVALDALTYFADVCRHGDTPGLVPCCLFTFAYNCLSSRFGQQIPIDRVVDDLELAANRKHAYAQYKYGQCLLDGKGRSKDQAKAFLYFLRSAESGDLGGTFFTAKCYADGIGTVRSTTEANHWFRIAAKMGHPEAIKLLSKESSDSVVAGSIAKKTSTHEALTSKTDSKTIQENVLLTMKRIVNEEGDASGLVALGKTYLYSKGPADRKEKAYELFCQAASLEDKEGRYYMALCLENGYGVEKSVPTAIQIFERLSAEGYDGAMCRVAYHYFMGKYLPQDDEKSATYLLRAAKQNHSFSQYRLALCYEGGMGVPKSAKTAFFWMRCAAQHGQSDAFFPLAKWYLEGSGTRVNFSEGLKWMRLAAKYGNKAAIKILPELDRSSGVAPKTKSVTNRLIEVIDIDQDDNHAPERVAEKHAGQAKDQQDDAAGAQGFIPQADAAQVEQEVQAVLKTVTLTQVQGYAGSTQVSKVAKDEPEEEAEDEPSLESSTPDKQLLAMDPEQLFKIGLEYHEGTRADQTKDYHQAFRYFLAAATLNHARAQYMLGTILYEGLAHPINDKFALKWIRRAADSGDVEAQYTLGRMAYHGHAQENSDSIAFRYLTKAAAHKHAKALRYLAYCHEEGRGTSVNTLAFYRLLAEATNAGDSFSMATLAYHHLRGNVDGAPNIRTALDLLRRGIEKKDARCYYFFGYCHEAGIGVAKDLKKAKEYYTHSANLGLRQAAEAIYSIKSREAQSS